MEISKEKTVTNNVVSGDPMLCELRGEGLKTLCSGLSTTNFKDDCGNATKEQCLGMIAEISVFSASGEMLVCTLYTFGTIYTGMFYWASCSYASLCM